MAAIMPIIPATMMLAMPIVAVVVVMRVPMMAMPVVQGVTAGKQPRNNQRKYDWDNILIKNSDYAHNIPLMHNDQRYVTPPS